MGLIMRKPVFRVSDQVRLKSVSSATETSQNIETLHAAGLAIIFPESKFFPLKAGPHGMENHFYLIG